MKKHIPIKNRIAKRRKSAHPRWYTLTLLGLALATVVVYLINLSANGWANSFYSAAVQAGSENWEAFLFGSLDSSNAITVDKPPASLWLMALSVRLFGLGYVQILAPQVILAGLTVLMLARSTRIMLALPTLKDDSQKQEYIIPTRWALWASLAAAGIFMLSPVAALMFRYNNPDALLVTLMVAAVLATQNAIWASHRGGRVWTWLVAAGIALGFGFLTKQFQVLLITPALALAWVVSSRGVWWKKLVSLLWPVGSMLISAGWWIALVELVPESMRPYVGGSQTNSFLELTFGYNGLGRLTGDEEGSVGGGQGGGWGETGITRLFVDSFGSQIAWLLPAALILLVSLIVWLLAGKRMRMTDALASSKAVGRNSLLTAGVILWGGWLVVTWLTLSFMQGIVHEYYTVALTPAIAVIVATGAAVLYRGARTWGTIVLALTVALTSSFQYVLLAEFSVSGWFRWTILIAGLIAGVLFVIRSLGVTFNKTLGIAILCTSLLAGMVAPAALTVATIAGQASGSIITIGGDLGGRTGGPGGGHGGPGGGMGSLLNGASVSTEVEQLLVESADSYTWVAATTGSQSAASYQLASEEPVMAIGGFNGTDPSPTLEEFQSYVQAGQIHYYIGGSHGGPGGENGSASEIQQWVEENYTAFEVDGVTIYDLT